MNQSGEDFLHEAKVTVFDVTFNIPLPGPIFDYQPMRIIAADQLCGQIHLETQTFKFMRFVIVFILKLKMILLGYKLELAALES